MLLYQETDSPRKSKVERGSHLYAQALDELPRSHSIMAGTVDARRQPDITPVAG
jgi:hypothetical protein